MTGKKKNRDNTKKQKTSKKKNLPGLDFDILDLYSDFEDFVEFEDLSTSYKPSPPKKRCLRSSSTEEKESNLINSAGPSVSSTVAQPKKETKNSKGSKNTERSKKNPKTKTEKSATKGGKSSRKTGSCASSR